MNDRAPIPLIGVTGCFKERDDGSRYHSVEERYVEAAAVATGCVPVIVPAIAERADPDVLLGRLDGILFTGSPSNVDPRHYGGPDAREGNIADPVRDATTLPLLRRAVAEGLPVLAICRGFQELNVAMGGSLHQHVQELPGRFDHRSPQGRPLAERFAPRHPIAIVQGGMLQEILEGADEIVVNSLHGQGIDRPADVVRIEALAEDGTIEAISLPGAAGFVLGLQWHPEWDVMNNPDSVKIFAAFARACHRWAASKVDHERHRRVA